jgi:hypothetical protein
MMEHWIVTTILFVILTTAFFFQVQDCIAKFLSGKSTTSLSYTLSEEPLRFPVVTICPSIAYNSRELLYHAISPYNTYEDSFLKWPSDPESIKNAWKDISHPLSDLLQTIRISAGDNQTVCKIDENFNVTNNPCDIVISPVDTILNGRCYSLYITRNIYTTSDIVILELHNHEVKS